MSKINNRKINQSEKLLIIILSLIIFLSFLFVGISTITRARNDLNQRTYILDGKDDTKEVLELIKILKKKDQTPEILIKTMQRLGGLKSKKAIPELINYIDFKREIKKVSSQDSTQSSNFKVDGSEITHWQDPKPISWQYPARDALIRIGEPSLPDLEGVIENEEPSSVKSQNALYAIQQIFVEDQLKAVLYLEKAMTESKIPDGSKRLQVAAQKTKEKWDNLQKNLQNE